VDVYVSTAWLSEAGWVLLEEAVRLSGFRRYAEVVRAAVNTAVVEIARGAGLVPPASVEVERKAPFRPQLGRLREVAVRLLSSIPLRRIQKWVAERLGVSKASMGVALEWALATFFGSDYTLRRLHHHHRELTSWLRPLHLLYTDRRVPQHSGV
jgi:hypothetical protein